MNDSFSFYFLYASNSPIYSSVSQWQEQTKYESHISLLTKQMAIINDHFQKVIYLSWRDRQLSLMITFRKSYISPQESDGYHYLSLSECHISLLLKQTAIINDHFQNVIHLSSRNRQLSLISTFKKSYISPHESDGYH